MIYSLSLCLPAPARSIKTGSNKQPDTLQIRVGTRFIRVVSSASADDSSKRPRRARCRPPGTPPDPPPLLSSDMIWTIGGMRGNCLCARSRTYSIHEERRWYHLDRSRHNRQGKTILRGRGTNALLAGVLLSCETSMDGRVDSCESQSKPIVFSGKRQDARRIEVPVAVGTNDRCLVRSSLGCRCHRLSRAMTGQLLYKICTTIQFSFPANL
jgi:hypothetical protein